MGLHLVQLLRDQGHRVTVLNRGQTQGALPVGVDRIVADRSNPVEVVAVLRGRQFDAAFDISGYTPAEVRPVVDTLDGNVGAYVFCSTAAVYAAGDVAPIREDSPLNRGDEAGTYSGDKILCEYLLLEAFGQRGFPATIIRPPYVYGPNDHLVQRLFGIFARLSQGRKIIVPGEGMMLIHSVHVDDLASAFTAVPDRSEAPGQAYSVVGQEAITFNGFLSVIASIMSVNAEIVHVGAREYETMLEEIAPIQAEEIFDYAWRQSHVYTNEKLRQLGWTPLYDLHDGVEMTYRWWLEQGMDREPRDIAADDVALAWLADRT